MRRAAGLLAALVPILLPSAVSAASQDIIESHRYMMGDNDSRNDSRQICFMEAKRKALDQAGVLIVSELDLSQFEQSGIVSPETTKKRVRSFAAAILKVETIAEHVELQGAASVFDCTVRVSVDLDDVKLRLHAIANDHTTQDKIEAQAGQIQGLETRIKELNDRLQSTAAQPVLRKERTVAIEGLDTAENARLAALQNIAAAEQRVSLVVAGMTRAEVRQVAGEPRGVNFYDNWNYGRLWVVFGAGNIVSCVSQRSEYC